MRRPGSPARLIAVLLLSCSAHAIGADEPMWLDPRLRPLQIDAIGPFIKLGDGAILCVKSDSALISRDDGKSWQARPIFGEHKLRVRPEMALVRTRKGAIVCVFIDDLNKRWKWDATRNTTDGDVWLHTWVIRSLDEGVTWQDLRKIQDGYCGAIRDLIETDVGDLVVPGQKYLPGSSRHATVPYISRDQGLTWTQTGVLDLGGRGHHDGSIEATVVQLRDHRLWMLLRTTHDVFWQSYSTDGGATWGALTATDIDASSSPAMLKRLESDRLVLVWNRLYPQGATTVPRRGGAHSEREASWHRGELSIAFSDDDAATWTTPVVLARNAAGRISYPFIFEPRHGILWITTMQGGLKAELTEADFCKPR